MSLREHRRFTGGVEGVGSGKSGAGPERSSVPWHHQFGCPLPALIHVGCFFTSLIQRNFLFITSVFMVQLMPWRKSAIKC